MLLSVVSPVYKAETLLPQLVKRVRQSVEMITPDFEIILVNDASPDNSWQVIEQICADDKQVIGVNLSRNFGQHYSITAGLSFARGEWIVVMDCDLQDRPEEIPALYHKALEGYDSVFAQRVVRKDGFFKKNLSKLFYRLFSYLTETKQDPTVANFGIYHQKVIQAILSMNDQIRFFPTMVQWVGFRKTYLPVNHGERPDGNSTYNFNRLFHLALDTIIAFSDKPLRIMAKLGVTISLISFFVGAFYMVLYFLGKISVLGFPSIIISLWFLGGLIIFFCGVLGIYIGKTFEKVKNRPTFIVQKVVNLDDCDNVSNNGCE